MRLPVTSFTLAQLALNTDCLLYCLVPLGLASSNFITFELAAEYPSDIRCPKLETKGRE